MKTLKSLALIAFLVCALGNGVRAGDIDTPGKTATTAMPSFDGKGSTTSMTDEIMLELLLTAVSLM